MLLLEVARRCAMRPSSLALALSRAAGSFLTSPASRFATTRDASRRLATWRLDVLLMRAVPLGPAVLLVLAELVQLKSGHASLTSSSLKNPWKRGLRWPGRRPRGPTPMMGLVAAMAFRSSSSPPHPPHGVGQRPARVAASAPGGVCPPSAPPSSRLSAPPRRPPLLQPGPHEAPGDLLDTEAQALVR